MFPLKDYSHIRGVCAAPAMPGPNGEHEKEMLRGLEMCKRLNLNSCRVWLEEEDYWKNPDAFLSMLVGYVRRCYAYGVTVMPILWNGNFIRSFTPPTEEEWLKKEAYAQAVINALRNEEGLLMWDVINEPFCNDFMNSVIGTDSYEERFQLLRTYVRRLTSIVRRIDSVNCITVGHERPKHCPSTNDLVDVISFHDYSTTRREMEEAIAACEVFSREFGKPILNTETGCVGRANPYDVEIELCAKHQVGWYLFLLTHEGFWGDIHGIVYPDGTIRDPSVIAAIYGFFRNRSDDRIRVDPNKEGHAYRAVKAVEDALRVEPTTLFMSAERTPDMILDAAEYCVNLLEGAEMVAMWDAPSAKLAAMRAWDWAHMTETQRRDSLWKIRSFAFEMAELVKKNCLII